MSERTSYEHGRPSWIDHSSDDPDAAVAFYKELFGWESNNVMPEGEGPYYMCSKGGKTVAAVGGKADPQAPTGWNTYVAVDSADETAAKVEGAGGTVAAPPFDVMDAGRMAVLADPSGIPFCIWEANEVPGAQLVNEPGAWVWSELITTDVEGSKAFYGELFGWRTSQYPGDGPPYTLVHLAGDGEPDMESVVGGMVPASEGAPRHWNSYVAVDDADAAVSRCEELGGSVVAPATDMPWGRMAVVRDPLGGGFTILQPPEGAGG